MTLQECYAALGGDYDEVIGRLRSERMVQKFVLRFLDDKSYELLCGAMESGNYEEAFRAAHTIKGVCQNLAFTRLFESSNQLSEALRNGFTPEAPRPGRAGGQGLSGHSRGHPRLSGGERGMKSR